MARLGRSQPINLVVVKGRPGVLQAEIAQAVETDTAQRITPSIGLVVESDTAQVVTARKAKTIDQVTETDTAQAITARKTVTVNQTSETDEAQAITPLRSYALGQAAETDTAQTITAFVPRTIHQAVETDTALTITPLLTGLYDALVYPLDDSTVELSGAVTFVWDHPGVQTQVAFKRRRVPAGGWEWWNGTGWQSTEVFVATAVESVTFDPGEW